jgi:hypothetical protein
LGKGKKVLRRLWFGYRYKGGGLGAEPRARASVLERLLRNCLPWAMAGEATRRVGTGMRMPEVEDEIVRFSDVKGVHVCTHCAENGT